MAGEIIEDVSPALNQARAELSQHLTATRENTANLIGEYQGKLAQLSVLKNLQSLAERFPDKRKLLKSLAGLMLIAFILGGCGSGVAPVLVNEPCNAVHLENSGINQVLEDDLRIGDERIKAGSTLCARLTKYGDSYWSADTEYDVLDENGEPIGIIVKGNWFRRQEGCYGSGIWSPDRCAVKEKEVFKFEENPFLKRLAVALGVVCTAMVLFKPAVNFLKGSFRKLRVKG